jgi:hypothetical protein
MSDYRRGLVIGFIEHIYTQLVTTSNYKAVANSCTRLLTTVYAKSSQFVFTSRFLVTDPNNVLCLRPCLLFSILQQTKLRATVSVTLRLAVYFQLVRLRDKPLETHQQRFFPTEHLWS